MNARLLTAVCILLLFACISPGIAWSTDGLIREFPLPSELRPYAICTLSDGSVWVTHEDPAGINGSLIALDTSDGSYAVYTAPFNGKFNNIACSPDDILWITDWNDRLVEFDPAAHTFTAHDLDPEDFPVPLGYGPYGIYIAEDGKIWFTVYDTYSSIGVYDPATDNWESYNLPTTGDFRPGYPVDITAENDGSLWFTMESYGGRWAGLGHLDPDTDDLDTWTDPAVFFGPDPAPTDRLRKPWGLALTGHDPARVWFIDRSGGRLFSFDEADPPIVNIYDVPLPAFTDAHFIAVDPQGIFWFAPYGSPNSIGTFNPATTSFDSRTFRQGLNPMGITISPLGEVWWTETGNITSGEHKGIGRFIPFKDSDRDGIDDRIDTLPTKPSKDFKDKGTSTSGTIVTTGGQTLMITDATTPYGVRVMAGRLGGRDPAVLSVCPLTWRTRFRVVVTSGDDFIITCGGICRILSGTLDARIGDGISMTVPGHASFLYTEQRKNFFTLRNLGMPGGISDLPADNAGTGNILIGYPGWIQEIPPGDSLTLINPDLDIRPGTCPNTFNPAQKGVIPIAIAGSSSFNVRQINNTTLLLHAEGISEGIQPGKISIKDVTTSTDSELCVCDKRLPDSVPDLVLEFNVRTIASQTGPLQDGQELVLSVSGSMNDGTEFIAADCVKVVKR